MSGFGNLLPFIPEADQHSSPRLPKNLHEAALAAQRAIGALPSEDDLCWWETLNQLSNTKAAR